MCVYFGLFVLVFRFDFVFVFAWWFDGLIVCCFVLIVFGFALCGLLASSWL